MGIFGNWILTKSRLYMHVKGHSHSTYGLLPGYFYPSPLPVHSSFAIRKPLPSPPSPYGIRTSVSSESGCNSIRVHQEQSGIQELLWRRCFQQTIESIIFRDNIFRHIFYMSVNDFAMPQICSMTVRTDEADLTPLPKRDPYGRRVPLPPSWTRTYYVNGPYSRHNSSNCENMKM